MLFYGQLAAAHVDSAVFVEFFQGATDDFARAAKVCGALMVGDIQGRPIACHFYQIGGNAYV